MNQSTAFRLTVFGHVLVVITAFLVKSSDAVHPGIWCSFAGHRVFPGGTCSSVSSPHFAEGKGCFHHSNDIALTRVRNEGLRPCSRSRLKVALASSSGHPGTRAIRVYQGRRRECRTRGRKPQTLLPPGSRPEVRDLESVPSKGREGECVPGLSPSFSCLAGDFGVTWLVELHLTFFLSACLHVPISAF